MRLVSWIVVVGALAWLVYAQLNTHVPREQIIGIPDVEVRGSIGAAPGPDDSGSPGSREGMTGEPGAGDASMAAVPYAEVYPTLAATAAMASLERVDATTTILSNDAAVGPGDILLYLDDGERIHRFALTPAGELRVPARDDWRDAGHVLLSNQPQGSLQLKVSMFLGAPSSTKVEYAWFEEGVNQLNDAMAMLEAAGGISPSRVVGLVFEFEPGELGTVTTGAAGDVLTAGPDGRLRLEMNETMREANPTLAFSTLPSRIVPLVVPVRDRSGGGAS